MAKIPMTANDMRRVNQEIKELKQRLETALGDEQDAARMYSEIARVGDRIDTQLFGRKVADIKNQEIQHAESIKRMIQKANDIIVMNEKTIKNLQEFEAEDKRHGRRR